MSQIELLHVQDNSNTVRLDLKCTACELCHTPKLASNCLYGEGSEGVDLMFVGKAPGAEDDAAEQVYSGPTGRLLRQLLDEVGLTRVYITNCLKCFPGETKLKQKHFNACKAHLIRELNQIKPKALVAVGAEALEFLTGQSGVRKLRKHGLPCLIAPSLTVYPTQQPAVLFHAAPAFKGSIRTELIEDLRWLKTKADQGELGRAANLNVDYKMAETLEDFDAILAELDAYDVLSCDFETTSTVLDDGEVPTAIGFSCGPRHGRAIPLYAYGITTLHYWTDEELEGHIIPKLREFLVRKKLYGHNFIQFDQKWVKKFFGIDRLDTPFDTMLAHYLLDEERGTHDLEQVAMRYTDMPPWKRLFTVKDTGQMCDYLCRDVDATSRVRTAIEPLLNEAQHWLLQNLLLPLAFELRDMEYQGVCVNSSNMSALQSYLEQKIATMLGKLRAMPEVQAFEFNNNKAVNVDAPADLAEIMEKYLKLPCIERTPPSKNHPQGAYSTNKDVLEALAKEPFVQLVQQTRGLGKLRSTYCEGMQSAIRKDGRIHTNFKIHGTVTGRLSSSEPNLQNIPREDTAGKVLEDGGMVKNVFCASDSDHVLLQADYGQAELRVLAMYSKDPVLIDIFQQGQDIHLGTAAMANGIPIGQVTKTQRTDAKRVNFGIIYGRSEDSICDQFDNPADGHKFYSLHQQTFKRTWSWMNEQEGVIKQQGYQETFFGRRRRYEGHIDARNIRQALNFPIQSTASDFTLLSLVRCAKAFKKLGLRAWPVLTVHDSIVFEVHADDFWQVVDVVHGIMTGIKFNFMNVPMTTDLEAGFTWGNLKEVVVEEHRIAS